MKNYLTELWFGLATFSYREAIKKSVVCCNGLFNQIYGSKHFSRRCFLPSSVISLFSVFLFSQLFGNFSHFQLFQNVFDFWAIAVFALFINVWADYFSLVETRWLLRLAERIQLKWLLLLLILDIACTSAIYIISLWLFFYLPVAVAGCRSILWGRCGSSGRTWLTPCLTLLWRRLSGPPLLRAYSFTFIAYWHSASNFLGLRRHP